MARGVKTGGRKVGSVNKTTNRELKKAIEDLSIRAVRDVLEGFDDLSVSDKLKVLQTSLKHVLPTLSSVESSVDIVGALGTQISDMEEAEVIEIARLIQKRLN